jgi:hypothetical protein
MEIERVRFMQDSRNTLRQHINELDFDSYTTDRHFVLLGQRILNLPGVVDDMRERYRSLALDLGEGLELEFKCDYGMSMLTDDPSGIESIRTTWGDTRERFASPFLVEEVSKQSKTVEGLFSLEQTIIEAEVTLDVIPDEALVMYKNEPSLLVHMSQQER